MPLDGIWLRAPYLHNGSVPTLRDLLEPRRSGRRRSIAATTSYDPAQRRLRQRLRGGAGPHVLQVYDTALPGNGNVGHEGTAYGTELPARRTRTRSSST